MVARNLGPQKLANELRAMLATALRFLPPVSVEIVDKEKAPGVVKVRLKGADGAPTWPKLDEGKDAQGVEDDNECVSRAKMAFNRGLWPPAAEGEPPVLPAGFSVSLQDVASPLFGLKVSKMKQSVARKMDDKSGGFRPDPNTLFNNLSKSFYPDDFIDPKSGYCMIEQMNREEGTADNPQPYGNCPEGCLGGIAKGKCLQITGVRHLSQ